jgi:hypothetical protein
MKDDKGMTKGEKEMMKDGKDAKMPGKGKAEKTSKAAPADDKMKMDGKSKMDDKMKMDEKKK